MSPQDSTSILARLSSVDGLPETLKTLIHSGVGDPGKAAEDFLAHVVSTSDYDHFDEALDLVRCHEEDLENDPNVMQQAAFAAWAKGYNEDCEKWARRVVLLSPGHAGGYLRLGMGLLTAQRFLDAFLVLSAGMANSNAQQQLKGWWALSRRMALGPNEVSFEKFGKEFKFRLTCFSTQAVESDMSHLRGAFTEEDELQYLAGALSGARHLMEVGSLVGNHTVFLASMVCPESYLVVDADSRSIAETKANVELNQGNFPETKFEFLESALAGEGGRTVMIGGKPVTTRTLLELVPAGIDFLKIDIDGMEGALLAPLAELLSKFRIKLLIEVESRYEPDYLATMGGIGYALKNRIGHGAYANLFFEKGA